MRTTFHSLPQFFVSLFSACATKQEKLAPDVSVETGSISSARGFQVPHINRDAIAADDKRRIVDPGNEAPETVVVDFKSRQLFLVMEHGKAVRYRIAPLEMKSAGGLDGAANLRSALGGGWGVTAPNRAADLSAALVRMKNSDDAADLLQRMPAGAQVVFPISQEKTI